MQAKILIAGAGPAGLTLALELARQGIKADIIDKKAGPSTLSRAVGILPITMKLLEACGASAKLMQESITIENAVFYKYARKIIKLAVDQDESPQERLFSLAQNHTETILSELLAEHGINVQYGSEMTAVEQNPEQVQVTVNGESRTYDYLVGADGVRSPTRKMTGIEFPGFDLDEIWSIADIYTDNERYSKDFNIHLNKDGKLALVVPLESHRVRVVSNTGDVLDHLPDSLRITEVKHSGTFKIGVRQASEYQRGRVFLVGDAAHCHSPVGGRGMNLSIADAVDLAQRFVEGGLEDYHRVRYPIGAQLIADTERARKTILSPNRITRNLALLVLKIVSIIPPLNKLFLKKVLLAANTV
ncbi:MAG: FAD-dependent monooxygenase [Candidatus Melainabacteria bacterium]|nr:FAD-dependent monooxygenase [Candidatus Melainabacteria bacterium]